MKRLFKIGAAIALALCVVSQVDAKVKEDKQDKQDKQDKEIVTTCFNAEIDCEKCTAKIMNLIPYQKGVKDVVVDIEKRSVLVSYDAAKSSDEELVKSFARLDIKASPVDCNVDCCDAAKSECNK